MLILDADDRPVSDLSLDELELRHNDCFPADLLQSDDLVVDADPFVTASAELLGVLEVAAIGPVAIGLVAAIASGNSATGVVPSNSRDNVAFSQLLYFPSALAAPSLSDSIDAVGDGRPDIRYTYITSVVDYPQTSTDVISIGPVDPGLVLIKVPTLNGADRDSMPQPPQLIELR